MHSTSCCPEIINGSIDLLPACTNASCQKKIVMEKIWSDAPTVQGA